MTGYIELSFLSYSFLLFSCLYYFLSFVPSLTFLIRKVKHYVLETMFNYMKTYDEENDDFPIPPS